VAGRERISVEKASVARGAERVLNLTYMPLSRKDDCEDERRERSKGENAERKKEPRGKLQVLNGSAQLGGTFFGETTTAGKKGDLPSQVTEKSRRECFLHATAEIQCVEGSTSYRGEDGWGHAKRKRGKNFERKRMTRTAEKRKREKRTASQTPPLRLWLSQ